VCGRTPPHRMGDMVWWPEWDVVPTVALPAAGAETRPPPSPVKRGGIIGKKCRPRINIAHNHKFYVVRNTLEMYVHIVYPSGATELFTSFWMPAPTETSTATAMLPTDTRYDCSRCTQVTITACGLPNGGVRLRGDVKTGTRMVSISISREAVDALKHRPVVVDGTLPVRYRNPTTRRY
jgi:hypothetical protein